MIVYEIAGNELKKTEDISEEKQGVVLLFESEVGLLEQRFPSLNKQLRLHKNTTHTMLETHGDYYFFKMRKRKGSSANNASHHYSLYLDNSHFFVVGESEQDCSVVQPILTKLKSKHLTLGAVVYRFLLLLIEQDFEILQELEKQITALYSPQKPSEIAGFFFCE